MTAQDFTAQAMGFSSQVQPKSALLYSFHHEGLLWSEEAAGRLFHAFLAPMLYLGLRNTTSSRGSALLYNHLQIFIQFRMFDER